MEKATLFRLATLLTLKEEDKRVESRRSESGRRTSWKLTTREYNRRAGISD